MKWSALLVLGFAVLLLAACWGCGDTDSTVSSAGIQTMAGEEPDLYYLGGTRYAESVPGTDTYYAFEVRFTRPGGAKTYTFEELTDLELRGSLHSEDEIHIVWLRSEIPVSSREVMRAQTTVHLSESYPSRPACPSACEWDPVRRECMLSWGCIKASFR